MLVVSVVSKNRSRSFLFWTIVKRRRRPKHCLWMPPIATHSPVWPSLHVHIQLVSNWARNFEIHQVLWLNVTYEVRLDSNLNILTRLLPTNLLTPLGESVNLLSERQYVTRLVLPPFYPSQRRTERQWRAYVTHPTSQATFVLPIRLGSRGRKLILNCKYKLNGMLVLRSILLSLSFFPSYSACH